MISGLFWNTIIFLTSRIRTSVMWWNYIRTTVVMAHLLIRLYSMPSHLSTRGMLPSKETLSSKRQEGSLCSNALRVRMFGPIVRHCYPYWLNDIRIKFVIIREQPRNGYPVCRSGTWLCKSRPTLIWRQLTVSFLWPLISCIGRLSCPLCHQPRP